MSDTVSDAERKVQRLPCASIEVEWQVSAGLSGAVLGDGINCPSARRTGG